MINKLALNLDAAVRAVCPIDGISIGRLDDRSTWRVDYVTAATTEQRAAAQSVIERFDVAPVPSIDRRQCRLWLLANGKTREDVEAAIAAIPDPVQRETARIEWEDAKTFHHDHPLMLALAPVLGIPAETLPDSFSAAALL